MFNTKDFSNKMATRKKKGTDMIKPTKHGALTDATLYSPFAEMQRAFVAGVNHVLTLNGHDPIKL